MLGSPFSPTCSSTTLCASTTSWQKFWPSSSPSNPLFGLTLKNYGELAVSGIAGSILFFPLLWAYLTGSRTFRAISHRLVVLIGLLVFFGVVVDVGRGLIDIRIGMFMDIIEEGGEMVAASCIAWYAFKVAAREDDSAPRLFS